ncbi:MAG: HD domain-containing protein [Lachnospiraceae bacterium]|nr:HD domain-containing protein [Lachnospiraceae bacterium]
MAKRLLDKIYIIHLLVFILIIAGFLFVRYQVNHVDPVTYKLNASQDMNKQDLGFEIPISKGWLEKFGLRANQYDGALINNTKYPFVDWSVEFTLPADSEISDYWSFEYEIGSDNRIKITGLDFNNNVLPNDRATFGFILFSPLTTDIEEFTLKATPVYPATHFAMFYVTSIIAMIWLIALISTISIRAMSVYYKRRREMDRQIIIQSIKTFTNFIDAKDPYTNGHSSRVAQYTKQIASHMGFNEEELDNIYYIALLHDVGKMSIPDNILNKPAKLSPEERKVIETHTTHGAEMLKDFSAIPDIIAGALYHHERYDGGGYPQHLKGENIPLIARIICVADSYDAMSSFRCYRDALSKEEILSELDACAGKQFDPEAAAIMIDLILNNEV